MGREFVRYDIWNGEQGYLGFEWRLERVFMSFGMSALANILLLQASIGVNMCMGPFAKFLKL